MQKERGIMMDDEQVKQCRAELKRVLNSKAFHTAPSLKRFLEYTAGEVLSGRGNYFPQETIARALGKGKNFDPKSNPLIRVQAGRLRARLSDYYRSEGADNELQIRLPVSSYTPEFLSRTDRDVLNESPMTTEHEIKLQRQTIDSLLDRVSVLEAQLAELKSKSRTE